MDDEATLKQIAKTLGEINGHLRQIAVRLGAEHPGVESSQRQDASERHARIASAIAVIIGEMQ